MFFPTVLQRLDNQESFLFVFTSLIQYFGQQLFSESMLNDWCQPKSKYEGHF